MNLKEYYRLFYRLGDPYGRELWHIPLTVTPRDFPIGFVPNSPSQFMDVFRLHWRNRRGFSLFVSAYGFRDLWKFSKQNHSFKGNFSYRYKASRFRKPFPFAERTMIDRLFWDFDMSSEMILKAEGVHISRNATLDDIESELKEIKAEEKRELENKDFGLRAEYYYHKFTETEYFREPLNEAKKLGEIFSRQFDIEPYFVFTGSKGVHCYFLFKGREFSCPTEVIKGFSEKIFSQLKLKTTDSHPLTCNAKSRVPFSYNPKTNLSAVPFNIDDDYFSIVDRSFEFTCKPKTKREISVEDHFGEILNQNSEELFSVLEDWDKEFNRKRMESRKRSRESHLFNQSDYTFRHKNQISINTPSDALRLLEFPCFQRLDIKNRRDLLSLNGYLSFTELESLEDIQRAFILFCNERGASMERTKEGLKQTESVYHKHYLTNSSMQRNGYCQNCKYQDCFRNKVRMSPLYEKTVHERAETYL